MTAASRLPEVSTRVSSMAQLSISGRPDPANARSDSVGNGSSKRRYVLTKSSGRPSADSNEVTASTRAGWVNTAGLTQAPSSAPVPGAATGPDRNGPGRVATASPPGAVPLGTGPTDDGRVTGPQVATVTATVPRTASPDRASRR
jgi:hypothetical protein